MSLTTADLAPEARSGTPSSWQLGFGEARALLRLAAPIALIALVNMGMSVTDTVMVSVLFGTDALAAVAVGSDFYSIVFYLCAGILAGITPFYSAAVTRADEQDRVRVTRIGWAMVGLLACFSVPLVWFSPLWLEHVGLEQRLLQEGSGYTQAMALTLIPMLGVMLYRTILTAAEKPKVFLKVTCAMLPLNALANYAFMMGSGPLPAFGPAGAGIASLLVAIASLGALAFIARSTTRIDAARSKSPFDWRGLGSVLRIGIPIGIATVTELGIYLGATLYAATLGAADVAAHTLTLRTAGIAYAVPAALLQAAMVRMARAESLGDALHRRTSGRAVITGSLGLSLLCGCGILALLLVTATPLANIFFDASSAGMAAAWLAGGLLMLLGCIEFVACPGLAAAGILRGRKDTKAPMTYTLIGYWGIGAPLGILLCEQVDAGITGIWLGLASGTLVSCALTLNRLRRKA